jgi:hypothetical protein
MAIGAPSLQPLAEIFSYDDLVAALRARATDRQIALSAEENAAVAGLASGYIGKLIGVNPTRHISMVSLGALLGLTGSKLLLVADKEAEQKFGPRLKIRNKNLVRGTTTYFVLTERKLRKNQEKGRKSRWSKLTKEERSEIMRGVVRARWSKPRVVEVKRTAT